MWKYTILLIVILITIAALYNGLTVRHYSLISDKLDDGQSIRAVLISDLHNHIYGDNQKDLISKVIKQNPDVILLAGDIADDVVPIEGTKLLLDGIKDIAPMFYVSGNHEYWSGDIENIKETIKSYGVTILEDEYKEIVVNDMPIIIAGVDDPEWTRYEKKDNRKSMDKNFKELADKPQFKILVAHRPEQIETYKKYPFDLVVSGHAHGGQVRIPFVLNGMLAPNQGWFPKYAGGMYKHGNLTHIVSRGVSYNPRLPRIFNPPEIVVIDITK
ncbi:MAG: metallophosphoesterase [Eubacteriales bacterium]|nr:metallophosphoesterase [Eubacteriales bacterium]